MALKRLRSTHRGGSGALPAQGNGTASGINYYFLTPQAPHLALEAPQAGATALAPHFFAPHIMAQPPRAAAVTTAEARVRARVEEREFMVMLLKS